MLELHTHSTFSDGTLTPTQLVERAAQRGVRALALTDHDTMGGVPEALMAAQTCNLEIVPGLELSTTHQGFSLHILGFYPDQARLADRLEVRRQERIKRAERMVEKLAALGLKITLPTVPAPGRVHIARALVRAGYVPSEREAFDRYLGDDKPAYEPYAKLSAVDGVRLLQDCGATTVWAHPLLFRGGPTKAVLAELVAAGLQGIEVYRPEISPSQQQRLEALAKEYGLCCTGGSDYHGTSEDKALDLNSLQLSLTLLTALKSRNGSTMV